MILLMNYVPASNAIPHEECRITAGLTQPLGGLRDTSLLNLYAL